MLTVHHLGHSQSTRIVWLCEELGIEYELKKHDRAPFLSPPELRALHPIGAAPVIEDGPVKLAESEACIEYIVHVHGNGRLFVKPGAANYADFLYWYHITNGTFQPAVGRIMAMDLAGVKPDNQVHQRYSAKIGQILSLYEDRLSQVPWLAGEEFTAADVQVLFSFTTMREFQPIDLTPYPNILKYVKRAIERPAFKRSLEKGDPDININEQINGKPPAPFKNFRPAL